jgi:sugar phosphate isomerase/epimerase
MIFGHDIVENAEILAQVVDNVEIVFFHTPGLHNFLSSSDFRRLARIADQSGVSYTVHLPDSLQIASPSAAKRAESVGLILELIASADAIDPRHFVLHVPYTPPTLVPVPGLYLKSIHREEWRPWLARATESLSAILEKGGPSVRLLIENINYSLSFLEPLVENGPCRICLDIGHLLLGDESVTAAIDRYQAHIREIHIHGIQGYRDHFSLALLPQDRLQRWLNQLLRIGYDGILNLEVFSPQELLVSLELLGRPSTSRLRALCGP